LSSISPEHWPYSFKLKHHAMVDVMTLAGLYTLRVLAGVVCISVAGFILVAGVFRVSYS
jgi:4-hydroxybenzoate polyprenyltransferase